MSITRNDVEYVAQLSRITLPPGEADKFTQQLARILDYVNQLNELDTAGVEPMGHPHQIQNVFRADEVRPSLTPAEALANAPQARTNCFLVPRVIDEG
jgi:aspartyl-tRNA(Asn)/glutamyl-tRNA(Gln) amidotransferase subunit C